MSIFSILCPVVALVMTAFSVRFMFKLATSQEELGAEKAHRRACQTQIDNMGHTMRELEAELRRGRSYKSIELKEASDTIVNLREDAMAARKALREARNTLSDYLLSDILSIKFTANIPQRGWMKTEFNLGVGSCGKEVVALHWTEKDDRYDLRQTCSDGERKEFTYFKKDVAGRIEMAYAAIKPTL